QALSCRRLLADGEASALVRVRRRLRLRRRALDRGNRSGHTAGSEDKRPTIAADQHGERDADADDRNPDLGEPVAALALGPWLQDGRGEDLDQLAGEDRLEGRFEPAMRVLQRLDAAG